MMTKKTRLTIGCIALAALAIVAGYRHLGPAFFNSQGQLPSPARPPAVSDSIKTSVIKPKNENPNRYEKGWPVLVEAAYRGDQQAAKQLLEQGANIEQKGPEGWTALMQAAGNGHAELTQTLIDAGALINIENTALRNAYEIASERGHTAIADSLYRQGAADNELRRFFSFVSSGNERYVHEMILDGLDPNRTDHKGRSALFYALTSDYTRRYYKPSFKLRPNIIKRLLDNGADPSLPDHRGTTPLIAFVSEYGNAQEILALLLGHGSDIAATDPKGQNIMFYLLEPTNFSKALEMGAAVNHADNEGNTPLHKWIRGMHVEMITQLLENGANLTIQNDQGQYPVDMFPQTNPGGRSEKRWNAVNEIIRALPNDIAPRTIEKAPDDHDGGS